MEKDWLCPLCALVRMPYGTTCKVKPCENEPHITGKFYLGLTIDSPKDAKSIGIASISNENEEGL